MNNAITVTNVLHHHTIFITCSGYRASEFAYLPKVPVNMIQMSPCGHGLIARQYIMNSKADNINYISALTVHYYITS